MNTECNIKQTEFLDFKPRETIKIARENPKSQRTRKVVGRFDEHTISSDGGIVLLREVEERFNIVGRLAGCFTDYRVPELITHSQYSLVAQRVLGLCCGYEDLNDHEDLRYDPLAQMFCGRSSPLAGKSTLNRLELTQENANSKERYKKVVAHIPDIDRLFVDMFMEQEKQIPKEIVLDIDITDDLLHGGQEGRAYNTYYGGYCYTPSYIFCGRHLLGCRLRHSKQDGAAGAEEEIARIVHQIREKWTDTRIILRGDGGFCRDKLMSWCEDNNVGYVLGTMKTTRLMKKVKKQVLKVWADYAMSKKPSRRFKSFSFRTKESWSRARRVVCKAEHLDLGANTRFIVTTLGHDEYGTGDLYERVYCARGEMENRIKAQQLHLFSDRTSTHWMRSNQLRMYFSAFAYILMERLREIGLEATGYSMAQCDTIRLKLLKVGTVIRGSARRISLSFSRGHPYGDLFRRALENLKALPANC